MTDEMIEISLDKLTFEDYQREAWKTAIYPNAGTDLVYPTLGLSGESGEFAEKVKKLIRDKGSKVDDEFRMEIMKELGDVLWYVSALAKTLNLKLGEVARINLMKLQNRQRRGKLGGSGDNR